MAMAVKASVVLASSYGAAAVLSSASRGFLTNSGGMRPDVVAATLVKVEDEWVAQASAFVECSSSSEAGLNCAIPGKAFSKSCGTIVSAVVQASSGDRDRVYEYMADVCKEPTLDEAHRARCRSLSTLVVQNMGADSYANREMFKAEPLCTAFWQDVIAQEKTAIEHRRAEEAKIAKEQAEHQKAEEEAAKRLQADEDARVAAAAKKAAEAAKAEEEAALAAKKAEESAKKEAEAVAAAAVKESNLTVGQVNHTQAHSLLNLTSNATKAIAKSI